MTEEHRRRTIQRKLSLIRGEAVDSIPTGSDIGGLPRGVAVEIFGPSGSGKTSLALAFIASWQRAGGAAAWIDAEHSFDPAYAAALGVAVERLPVAQPSSAEQAFAMLRQLALSGAVGLLVVDSAAALVPALELETALGESGPGLLSRTLASGLRKLLPALARTGVTVVFLNQTRLRPERAGAEPQEELSAGGPPLKLYAALRIALEPASGAGRTRFRVVKSKAGASFREGEAEWKSPSSSVQNSPETP